MRPSDSDPTEAPRSLSDDPRVLKVARHYLAELEAGRAPDRRAYQSRYPELAGVIGECLDGVELAHAAGRAMNPVAAPASTPEPLGDFRIVREIGRGGMGVVYEAVQLSLGRRVALKVLPFASGLDAKQLWRFKTESHAAAQLHHTNIVPVYAVGSDRGTHYYAMQLIEGKPLDSVIRELRGDDRVRTGDSTVNILPHSTRPESSPTPASARGRTGGSLTSHGSQRYRDIAKIAARVAEALEYAHDSGVIHRDIKPANLMLDGKGNVWVTDFGLAQVTSEANITRTGEVFGTLRYMSPEQATGQRVLVDHRTDIYSLGATLYELLTLRPIFDGEERQKLLFQILNDEPQALRSHDRAIPVELETIVLKATAKLPGDRYATAGEFATDLKNFLEDRPIFARRPSLADRTRKWLRRHPAYVGSGLVLLILAAIGLGITSALVWKAQVETKRSLDREKQRGVEVNQRFELARKAADEMILIADEELADDPMHQGLRRRLLESALAYYQEFIDLRKDDPEGQSELEATRERVKNILSDLAVMQGAGRHLLLDRNDVQDDLKLTPEQRQLARQLHDRIAPRGDRGREFRDLTSEQRSQRIVEEIKAHEAEVTAMLNPAQMKRLNELAVQNKGAFALLDPDIANALKISPAQKDKLRQSFGEFSGRIYEPGRGGPGGGRGGGPGGPGGPGGGGPGGGRGGPGGPYSPESLERALALLNPEQRETWRQLTGEPMPGLRSPQGFKGFGKPFPNEGGRP